MTNFFKKQKAKSKKLNAGMTYIELIVSLGIFAVMSGVVLFNYNDFGKYTKLKNLTQDIALQIVTAQKMALSGKLPSSTQTQVDSEWKPAYGAYFSLVDPISDPFQFTTFIDADNSKDYATYLTCHPGTSDSECTDVIGITTGKITGLCVFQTGSADNKCDSTSDSANSKPSLSITFTRPDSSAVIIAEGEAWGEAIIAVSDLNNPPSFTKNIIVYSSGRVEVK